MRIPPSRLGVSLSEETKKKMSEAHKGKKHSLEHILNWKKSRKGWKHSPESNMKNRMAHKGKALSESHRLNMSDAAKGKTHSVETRQKLSLLNSGSNNHFWKGGVSSANRTERQNIMSSREYREWRTRVFIRDNYTCVLCEAYGVKLNADHIKSFIEYPELRFDIDNGRTLCEPCHRQTDTYGGRTRLSKIITS